jgi:hypothetical protein
LITCSARVPSPTSVNANIMGGVIIIAAIMKMRALRVIIAQVGIFFIKPFAYMIFFYIYMPR